MEEQDYNHPIWDTVSAVLGDAKKMCWDECHKIYILRDEEGVARMLEVGYSEDEMYDPNLELIQDWYAQSCFLKFIQYIKNTGDSNDDYEPIIDQGFEWGDEEGFWNDDE